MSVRANPTVIGAFVLGACILLVAGLLLWGGTGMFKPTSRYVMYFDAAVTGLQKGAPVLVRGVRVGEVTDVQVRWGTPFVGVYVNVDPSILKGVRPRDVPAAIQNAIETRDLRAQLRMQSIVTGVLYVAIDAYPGAPIMLRGIDKTVPELPTVPTDLEKWTAKLEKISDVITALPIEELARSAIDTLDDARRLVRSPEISRALKTLDVTLSEVRGLVRKVDTVAGNLNAQVGPLAADARTTLTSAQTALADVPALVGDVRRVITKLDTRVEPLLASLQKSSEAAGVTLERAQVTLAGVDGTLNQDSALGYELVQALRELRETARAMGSLADYLERNPDSVVFGNRRPAARSAR